MVAQQQIATMVDWMVAPEWLTIEEACFLSGRDRGTMLHIIDVGGVDLKDDDEVLIERESLHEFLEILVDVLHWND